MTVNIADLDQFTEPVIVPSDGEAATGASLALFAQQLANRTRYLKNKIEVPATRTIVLPLGGSSVDSSLVYMADKTPDALRVVFKSINPWYQPLVLPDGATIVSLNFAVQQGNAGALGQMSVRVHRSEFSNRASVQLGSTLTFPDSTSYQIGNIPVASNNVIDNALYRYWAAITGSDLSITGSVDAYYGASAVVSDPLAPIKR